MRQMNEPPGARARVALFSTHRCRIFRDEEGQDVLLFVDNIFRFTQAGSEVPTLSDICSAVGYQPTLSTEMGQLKSASPRRPRVRLRRFRRFTFLQTILQTLHLQRRLLTLSATTVLSRSMRGASGSPPLWTPLDSTSTL